MSEAVAHHSLAAKERAMHLLTILQRKADNLYCVPTGATCEDIVQVLKGRYRDYQLVAAHRT
jgi:N-dimethylarginine dimethylaminohydrolase